jgi:hypothetical protein
VYDVPSSITLSGRSQHSGVSFLLNLSFPTEGGGAGRKKGMSVSKARIARWLMEATRISYESLGVPPPSQVKTHSTRAQATSWAALMGVEPSKSCAAATWSSSCTFPVHYSLNLFHQADAEFGSIVLRSACRAAERLDPQNL